MSANLSPATGLPTIVGVDVAQKNVEVYIAPAGRRLTLDDVEEPFIHRFAAEFRFQEGSFA